MESTKANQIFFPSHDLYNYFASLTATTTKTVGKNELNFLFRPNASQ